MKKYIKQLLLFIGPNRKSKVFKSVIETYGYLDEISDSKARKKIKDCYRYIVFNRSKRNPDELKNADKLRIHNMWEVRKYLMV